MAAILQGAFDVRKKWLAFECHLHPELLSSLAITILWTGRAV
jgi:hypothetical protein